MSNYNNTNNLQVSQNLVKAILQKDFVEAKQILKSNLYQRSLKEIESKRQEVAKNIY